MKRLMIFNKNNKVAQFIRFVIVGGMATSIHYIIYLGLNKLGIMINLAYTLGYFISFIFNFFASTYFTFRAKPSKNKGIKFFCAHVVNYLLQIALLNIYLMVGIPEAIAPIGVFVIAIPINFILVRAALKNDR